MARGADGPASTAKGMEHEHQMSTTRHPIRPCTEDAFLTTSYLQSTAPGNHRGGTPCDIQQKLRECVNQNRSLEFQGASVTLLCTAMYTRIQRRDPVIKLVMTTTTLRLFDLPRTLKS